jgi:hypothetical protein
MSISELALNIEREEEKGVRLIAMAESHKRHEWCARPMCLLVIPTFNLGPLLLQFLCPVSIFSDTHYELQALGDRGDRGDELLGGTGRYM